MKRRKPTTLKQLQGVPPSSKKMKIMDSFEMAESITVPFLFFNEWHLLLVAVILLFVACTFKKLPL